ncbi:MAG: hypothetical protein ACLR8P_19435 [Clostridium fessum]
MMVWNAVMLTGDRKRGKESREAGTEKKLTYRSVLPGIMAAVLTVSVPGIMNMALTAKADLITWLLQLIMLGCFFQYIHVYENHWIFLSGAAGSYFLSLTMKPTSWSFPLPYLA